MPDAKARLMVIEDSADYRALLRKLFTREGYEVSVAAHGQEALEQLAVSENLPDVILLDLMMPVMDGFEFRKRQLANDRFAAIPVILMTAHGNLQTEPQKLGLTCFVRKPVEMNELIRLVAREKSES